MEPVRILRFPQQSRLREGRESKIHMSVILKVEQEAGERGSGKLAGRGGIPLPSGIILDEGKRGSKTLGGKNARNAEGREKEKVPVSKAGKCSSAGREHKKHKGRGPERTASLRATIKTGRKSVLRTGTDQNQEKILKEHSLTY